MTKQHGGEKTGGMRPHGMSPVNPMSGGKRHKKSSKRHHSRSRKVKKGGEGIIATAAVPFGLLALQRFFKGSKTSKRNVRKIGSSFKRTFRRRH
jgi:hypothetical protein